MSDKIKAKAVAQRKSTVTYQGKPVSYDAAVNLLGINLWALTVSLARRRAKGIFTVAVEDLNKTIKHGRSRERAGALNRPWLNKECVVTYEGKPIDYYEAAELLGIERASLTTRLYRYKVKGIFEVSVEWMREGKRGRPIKKERT